MDLLAFFLAHGLLWLLCTTASALIVLRHFATHPLVETLARFMAIVVIFMFVGGWAFPAYIHTWDPAVFNFGPHWMFAMVIPVFASFPASINWLPLSGMGVKEGK